MDIHVLTQRLHAGDGPLYRRLADALRAAVRAGEIGVGSRLPSERDLAAAVDVSRTTVVNAYRMLRDEGLIAGERGSGTRLVGDRMVGPAVPPTAFVSAKLLAAGEPEEIDLSSSVIADVEPITVNGGLDLPADLGASRYEPLGLGRLRDQVARRFTERGLPTTGGDILITSGAQQAISLLFAMFGRDGGPIAVEAPTYAGALDAARAAGVALVTLPTTSTGPHPDAMRTLLTRHRPALLYVMTTVHNPTGRVLDPSRRRALLQIAAEHEVPVVDDEALSDLAFGPLPRHESAPDIVIGSLDKTCWPGLRVGWVRAPEVVMSKLARLKATADLGTAAPSQVVAAQLLDRLDDIAGQRKRQLQERLELLEELLRAQLPSWTWTRPAGGMFLWVRIPHGDAETFGEVALRHGVRVVPGPRTSLDHDFADRLRVSYAATPDDLRSGVARLRDAWERIEQVRPADRVRMELTV